MSTTAEKFKSQFPDVEWQPLPAPNDHSEFVYYGFAPGKTILKKGHTRSEGRRAFPSDVIYDRDVAVPLRDGVKIYVDVFRPVDSDKGQKVPAILPWSPYGKTGTGCQQYDNMAPFRVGLSLDQTSGYEKFEGPDPAEWPQRGYAIVNVDARGAGESEGTVVFWGQQEAEDVYDTIDWISKQPWCNGSVGMAGNSWLAISQINFASRLEHPALKALAPWEGRNDIYRDTLARGGKKHNAALHKFLLAGFAGPNAVENMPAMLPAHPFFDEYWASKYIETKNINVPLYVVASYSSQLHSRGAFHTFRTAKTTQKWLRVHPYQEWYDLYRAAMVDDLQKYFDRFLKGADNGWEADTPRVRLSLLGFEASGGVAPTVCERPEGEWPLARQDLRRYYLDARNMTLALQDVGAESSVTYRGDDMYACSDFTYYFDKYTEIAGYAKASLWMSCKDHDDLDVGVQVRKISKNGKPLDSLNYPCPVPIDEVPNVNTAKCLGPQGFLRASHSITKVDELSTEQEIFYQHDRRQPITPGSVVKVEITLWPMGMAFEAGEGFMLRVSGHDMNFPETSRIKAASANNENVGTHEIHTGGKYQSYVVLPFI
ncbi:Alpha/Beta hydrolase protein [Leptodontidium sp. 2 PMI_412]|nr:Alpha/Beta hydrolase protein [Leptodontidium sp. 2 PMI_412]